MIGQTVVALMGEMGRAYEIVAAHRFMEENRGSGKLVVVVDA